MSSNKKSLPFSALATNPILTGAAVLTLAGFASRIIGFFYRIFISQTFGEAGMGIFQLTAPVMALAYSLCCAGFQTAISRFVASNTESPRNSMRILLTGLSITGILSIILSFLTYITSDFLAVSIILEPRTAPLLRLLALSFPFSVPSPAADDAPCAGSSLHSLKSQACRQ